MDLEFIKTDEAFYGIEAEKINRNFSRLERSFNSLEARQSHFKGWFPTEQNLTRAFPSCFKGDFAVVDKTVYFWDSVKWSKSSTQLEDITSLQKLPYLVYPDPCSLPVYYRGDSIYLTMGAQSCFAHAERILFNIFIKSSEVISATFPFTEGIEIRKDIVSNSFYCVIPMELSSKMELGDYKFEMAAWYPTGTQGEQAVRRDRGYIFTLREFETII